MPTDPLSIVKMIWQGVLPFNPTVDGYDLVRNPYELLQLGQVKKIKNLIAGTVDDEGRPTLELIFMNQEVPDQMYEQYVSAIFQNLAQGILSQYPPTGDSTQNKIQMGYIYSDVQMTCATRHVLHYILKSNEGATNSYLYRFQHYPHCHPEIYQPEWGVYHESELQFLYPPAYGIGRSFDPTCTWPDSEHQFAKVLQGYWWHLVYFSDPNAGQTDSLWPLYNALERNFNLNDTLSVGTNLRKLQCDFWDTT